MSLEATNICVVDGDGKPVRKAKVETDPDAIELVLAEWASHLKRGGQEAFSYSAWLLTALEGLPVICIETRHAKAELNAMPNTTYRNDANGIAQLTRTGCFRAVHVKLERVQTLRALRVGRMALLGKLLAMVNTIRDESRPFGLKVGEISAGRLEAIKHSAG
ncbi:IS110 family transposase [Bradyrhizobium pachyrhizi]|uniref:IS110 family transposase n=1 Tax=Bradyrhizobium pachyrhizi TaxID=280333 RepID=UPI003D36D639